MPWAYAMARMDVGRATTSLYLVPAAAIVISLVWLGQVPGPVELAGGAIALAGVMLAGSRPRQRRAGADKKVSAGGEPRPVRNATLVEAGARLAGGAERQPVRNAAEVGAPVTGLSGPGN